MTANSEVISLVDTYLIYGAESAYGTAVSPTLMFGGLIQSGSVEIDRTLQEHAGMAGTGVTDGRITAKYTTGTVATRANMDFKAQGKSTKSLTICEEIDNVGTDSNRVFAGMVIEDWSIKCAVGEAVNVTLNMVGGKVAANTTISSRVAQYTDDLYNFSGGSIEMPDATVIGNVIDSVEISGKNDYKILYGFNSEAVNAKPGRLGLSLKATLKYLDDDQLGRVLGSATAIVPTLTPVTLALKFTKGTNLYVDFVFTNVVIGKVSYNHQLNDFLIEDLDLTAATLVVTEAAA
jgi:hypothetical protein